MQSRFIILGWNVSKQRPYRGFVESVHTEDLEDFEETGFTFDLPSNDGDQGVKAHRDPDLSADRIFGSPIKRFDPQVLLRK